MAITASEARKQLFPLIEKVNNDRVVVEITSRRGNAVLLSAEERAAALALPRALATRDRAAALAALETSNGLEIDYVEIADDFDPPVLAGAVRLGSTRLIDNVVLEGDTE